MTSTGRAAQFADWIAKHCEGLGLDYALKDVSHDFAAINLSGPKSREILGALTDSNISNDVLPFMRITDAQISGVPCRILRIGFLGELGFELHVPAAKAVHIWKTLHETGAKYGVQTTAIMGMSHLRLEKGHIIPGHDIDATATLFEAGFGFA